MNNKKIKYRCAVIGAGAWGSALAIMLSRKYDDITMWAYEPEIVVQINDTRINDNFLPDIAIPDTIRLTSNLDDAVRDKDLILSVIPSQFLRQTWMSASNALSPDSILISCTKGIEVSSLKRISQVLDECMPEHPKDRRVILSGPSFAKEVACNQPTSVVIAGENQKITSYVQSMLRQNTFLTFTSNDSAGVEIGGAIKNVIAIATGISEGLGLGNNARAAIITRGLYEMIKIGQVYGANPLTFSGLTGIGDLTLTCTSDLSRNHRLGVAIGQGQCLNDICNTVNSVAEGIKTAEAVQRISHAHGLKTPICTTVHDILFKELNPNDAVTQLCAIELHQEMQLNRPLQGN